VKPRVNRAEDYELITAMYVSRNPRHGVYVPIPLGESPTDASFQSETIHAQRENVEQSVDEQYVVLR
jgi:hypothetical protein